jgi:hypothetical protein
MLAIVEILANAFAPRDGAPVKAACPVCHAMLDVVGGRILAHKYVVGGWGYDASGHQVPVQFIGACLSRFKVLPGDPS